MLLRLRRRQRPIQHEGQQLLLEPKLPIPPPLNFIPSYDFFVDSASRTNVSGPDSSEKLGLVEHDAIRGSVLKPLRFRYGLLVQSPGINLASPVLLFTS